MIPVPSRGGLDIVDVGVNTAQLEGHIDWNCQVLTTHRPMLSIKGMPTRDGCGFVRSAQSAYGCADGGADSAISERPPPLCMSLHDVREQSRDTPSLVSSISSSVVC